MTKNMRSKIRYDNEKKIRSKSFQEIAAYVRYQGVVTKRTER